MLPRFAIVPAISADKGGVGARSYTETISGSFDIYDNREKTRLQPSYSSRQEADYACQKMNIESEEPERYGEPRTT